MQNKLTVMKAKAHLPLLLLVTLLAFTVPALATEASIDPISCSLTLTPSDGSGTGPANVSIKLDNVGETPVTISLLDPNGVVMRGFGKDGGMELLPGASTEYASTWVITEEQRLSDRVVFTALYSFAGADGQVINASRPILFSIREEKTMLRVNRTIEPLVIREGEEVVIRYLLQNESDVDMQWIVINDPEILSAPVVYSRLPAGEMAELTYGYTASGAQKTTKAQIYYAYGPEGPMDYVAIGHQLLTPVAIAPLEPDLQVRLQLSTQSQVQAGEEIELRYVLTNAGDVSIENIKITDAVLGDIDASLSIAPGGSHEESRAITVNQTATHQLTVVGTRPDGASVLSQSNAVRIEVGTGEANDAKGYAAPLQLEVTVEQAQEKDPTGSPLIILYASVTNYDEAAMENVVLQLNGSGAAAFGQLNPMETKMVTVSYAAQMGESVDLKATALDGKGRLAVSSVQVVLLYGEE